MFLSVCARNQHSFGCSSFASHIRLEPDYENLKIVRTAGDVELQKLSVVPQTVPKSRHTTNLVRSSRRSSDVIARLGAPLMSQATSIDHAPNSCAFDELRRRLPTINSSASSCRRCAITFIFGSCHIDACPAPGSRPSRQSNRVCCRQQIHWHSAHRIDSRSGAPTDKRQCLLPGRRCCGSRRPSLPSPSQSVLQSVREGHRLPRRRPSLGRLFDCVSRLSLCNSSLHTVVRVPISPTPCLLVNAPLYR